MFSSMMFPASGSTAATGNDGWVGAFQSLGRGTRAGVQVTPSSALSMTAVQRAVSILAESFAQLPCGVFKKSKDGQIERLDGHPVAELLNYQPNGWMTPFEYSEYKQVCLGLRGNSISMIVRGKRGVPVGLHPLNPDRVQIVVSPVDRMPYYRVLKSPFDEFEGVYSSDDIHHVRWISENGYAGLSPVALHAEAIGIAVAVEEHSASVFGNGTKLSGVLEVQQVIKDKEVLRQMKQDWNETNSGSRNAGNVAVLSGGTKFSPLSMSNEDAQLILTRGWGVKDISRIYGIPAHMLGNVEKGSKANIEQMSLEFLCYTLMPWIKRHEEAIERDLLTAAERKAGLFIKYDETGLIRGDLQSRSAANALGRQWGWLSVNEIRKGQGLPPIEGGDQYLVPMNMADGVTGLPIGNARDGSAPNDDNEENN